MVSDVINGALNITCNYLIQNHSKRSCQELFNELSTIVGVDSIQYEVDKEVVSYETVQEILSSLNENGEFRKRNGVYYTPVDVVEFILINSIKSACGKLKPNGMHVLDLNGIPYSSFCFEKKIFDPTCGAGEFLVAALEIKLDLLDLHKANITKGNLQKIVRTIQGNDVNHESVIITKIRLFLSALQRLGAKKVKGLGKILNESFQNYDFVQNPPDEGNQFDIIVGNPPYVEDTKSGLEPEIRYGNIYANVLENSAKLLNPDGALGFVVPLSYVSTPRMSRIRDALFEIIPEQYILSYSDRPDCLFTSVHQKLCILIGSNSKIEKNIFTTNYRYWYSEERPRLFNTVEMVQNQYYTKEYIPKLGNVCDVDVYKKVTSNSTQLLEILERGGNSAVYLNMRATFWIKAFLGEHNGGEYRRYECKDENVASYVMCLLNSSLFWWFWTVVSDCWHITRKELIGFTVPENFDFGVVRKLAADLEDKLEETKKYVGTKQTDYEYKHKDCLDEIRAIDSYVNSLYGLTEEEDLYIKNFAYRYRIGGGAEYESD